MEKLPFYSLSLKENKKIVPEFSASISLQSSGECAWADVTHRMTPWGHTRGASGVVYEIILLNS